MDEDSEMNLETAFLKIVIGASPSSTHKKG